MHRLIIAAVAPAAALPAPAFAQTSVANSMFGWMDRNHDDMLGTAENTWNQ